MKIVRLTKNDVAPLKSLIKIYSEVFELGKFPAPDDAHLLGLLSNPQIIFLVAQTNDVVIGGLTAHILGSIYFQGSEIYVYDIAVHGSWQRRGIGSSLMKTALEIGKKAGAKGLFVQADLADEHAISFYNKLGGIREDVRHFSFDL